MATYKYLDSTGLGQVWEKVKDYDWATAEFLFRHQLVGTLYYSASRLGETYNTLNEINNESIPAIEYRSDGAYHIMVSIGREYREYESLDGKYRLYWHPRDYTWYFISPDSENEQIMDSYITSNDWANFYIYLREPTFTVNITDKNSATVLLCNKSPAEIYDAYFSGKTVVAFVDSYALPFSQYQLSNVTTTTATFSNGFVEITVTETQNPSTAPSDVANQYSCSFVYIGIPNDIYSPQDGEILTYDNTNSVWVNSNLPTIPTASSTTPSVDGTGAVGTSTTYARADHVHPKITQTISISSNVITLTGSDGTTSSVTLPVYNGGVSS